jgi:uncharacterized protein DUF4400
MIYRMVYRETVMKFWLLGTAVFCVAGFVDGSMRRKIKGSAAGFASPLSFHLAGHGILLVSGAAVGMLVAPGPRTRTILDRGHLIFECADLESIVFLPVGERLTRKLDNNHCLFGLRPSTG